MSDKKEIVIKDACILFDLVDLKLLELFFQLEIVAYTTPLVIGEITDEEQRQVISSFINSGTLQIDNKGDFEAIEKIFIDYPGLSLPDSSVLELAQRKNAVIYSSDGGLRKAATKEYLPVRGVLWIVEELYNRSIIDKTNAIEKLNEYQQTNQWAPVKEIKILLDKLVNI